jgi:lipid-binding SYLF domain-containing protein
MIRTFAISICLMLTLAPTHTFAEEKSERDMKKIAKEQQGIREMRDDTLETLFEKHPAARKEVEDSVGVAVFSSLGLNLFLVSTARGGGIIRDTASGKETFMRMVSVGGGWGMGVKGFQVVFVFHTQTAYDTFLNSGWDFSGQVDAAAKTEDQGTSQEASATVVDGVSLYQLTKQGLALQATLQGTKYYKDGDLN